MTDQDRKWIIRTVDFKQSPFDLNIIFAQKADVAKKALKNLMMFWGVGVLCVFIPLAHFILVPLFLLLGIFFGYRAMGYKFLIKSGSAECPNCHATVEIKDLWFKDESRSRCDHCGTQIVITPE